jgi:hypothetical protein
LPDVVAEWATTKEVFRSGFGQLVGCYYLGSKKRPDDFILVTNDGGYYKVGAIYMIWSNKYCLARWSDKTMEKLVKDIMEDKKPTQDPEYQS